jgi:hypothetical protein
LLSSAPIFLILIIFFEIIIANGTKLCRNVPWMNLDIIYHLFIQKFNMAARPIMLSNIFFLETMFDGIDTLLCTGTCSRNIPNMTLYRACGLSFCCSEIQDVGLGRTQF